MVVPVRPLGIGHLTHDELPRRDLVTDVLEEPLACLVLSFVSRLGHDLFSSVSGFSETCVRAGQRPAFGGV